MQLNYGQKEPTTHGNDHGIMSVWRQGILGEGVTVAVVDDGIEHTHEDLKAAYYPQSSYDFNGKDADPFPGGQFDYHGTRCSGQIASTPNNHMCGAGIAPKARVAALRLISSPTTDTDESRALSYARSVNFIYSNSWGPTDDGATMEAPGPLASRALWEGVAFGRERRGSIFVFASGNAARVGDTCDYDGYASSLYVMAIGSIGEHARTVAYTEPCASLFAVAFSSGGGDSITTVDRDNRCTRSHSGTSASAPSVAGILALLLSARPDLTYRDVHHLVAKTAVVVDAEHAAWQVNAAGLPFSRHHGFGLIRADRLIEAAASWQTVGGYEYSIPWLTKPLTLGTAIGTAQTGHAMEFSFHVPREPVDADGFTVPELTERVALLVDLRHPQRGAVAVTLTSPAGTRVVMASGRPDDWNRDGFRNWTFTSVFFWDEDPRGEWRVQIRDLAPQSMPQMQRQVVWSQMAIHGRMREPTKPRQPPGRDYTGPLRPGYNLGLGGGEGGGPGGGSGPHLPDGGPGGGGGSAGPDDRPILSIPVALTLGVVMALAMGLLLHHGFRAAREWVSGRGPAAEGGFHSPTDPPPPGPGTGSSRRKRRPGAGRPGRPNDLQEAGHVAGGSPGGIDPRFDLDNDDYDDDDDDDEDDGGYDSDGAFAFGRVAGGGSRRAAGPGGGIPASASKTGLLLGKLTGGGGPGGAGAAVSPSGGPAGIGEDYEMEDLSSASSSGLGGPSQHSYQPPGHPAAGAASSAGPATDVEAILGSGGRLAPPPSASAASGGGGGGATQHKTRATASAGGGSSGGHVGMGGGPGAHPRMDILAAGSSTSPPTNVPRIYFIGTGGSSSTGGPGPDAQPSPVTPSSIGGGATGTPEHDLSSSLLLVAGGTRGGSAAASPGLFAIPRPPSATTATTASSPLVGADLRQRANVDNSCNGTLNLLSLD
ncbi:hypothetical protein H696_02095 [Fonticula alba]|uniref:P/Homo B domain-containing protein n=1 Tax=Fonticula alba TaxID=691883 RepID=A0A058ZA65_FONAL|nr:hypothetical protein H696_02095 [Fonticula alba]KCV71145.1 hypothetical protein H696_02095 [Fonticula alba]|eukprot:XP_009494268.1 hypothetical protein H696_02095 [Fonticula alba]